MNLEGITLIAGLPGSGKKTLAKFLSDHVTLVLSRFPTKLPRTKMQRLIISDDAFCVHQRRQQAAAELAKDYPDIPIKWMFFENDPEKCWNNLQFRGGKETKETIQRYSSLYVIPENYRGMAIWQPAEWLKDRFDSAARTSEQS